MTEDEIKEIAVNVSSALLERGYRHFFNAFKNIPDPCGMCVARGGDCAGVRCDVGIFTAFFADMGYLTTKKAKAKKAKK